MRPDFDLDKYQAFLWANKIQTGAYGDWVILDTETTGLGKTAQIIELAIISKYGSTLIDTLIKPTCPIEAGAIAVNQITEEVLKDAPDFTQVYPELKRIISKKKVLIYNASFDVNRLNYMCDLYKLETMSFQPCCVMYWYAQYYGSWSNYWGNYKWQKLPNSSHRAKGDCLACWNLVKKMAQPLSCPVKIEPPMFPKKQITILWTPWLEIELKIKGKNQWDSRKFGVNRPQIKWIEDKRTASSKTVNYQDTPGDDIPF